MTNSLTYKERVQGMLLGLHAGDALGATLEFKAPQPDLGHKDIIGGGDFNWRPGQATDDTDLMIFVLNSMTDRNTLDFGWAVHTLGSVVWALNHAENLEDALIKIANRGDDSDTAGAVVGAMFGALEGTQGIPKRWLDKLERAGEIKAEIDRLLAN